MVGLWKKVLFVNYQDLLPSEKSNTLAVMKGRNRAIAHCFLD